MSDERKFPIEQLGDAIKAANAPLLFAVQALTAELKAVQAGKGSSVPVEHKAAFDMERLIKIYKLWECGEAHCRDCTAAQNMHCADEYDILSDSQKEALVVSWHQSGEAKRK